MTSSCGNQFVQFVQLHSFILWSNYPTSIWSSSFRGFNWLTPIIPNFEVLDLFWKSRSGNQINCATSIVEIKPLRIVKINVFEVEILSGPRDIKVHWMKPSRKIPEKVYVNNTWYSSQTLREQLPAEQPDTISPWIK